VGKGISALCSGTFCESRHLATAKEIFNCVGETVVVPENLMNAVTGVSGSGPAYIYLVIEALIDAAVTVGISRDVATQLVLKTVTGSAEMVSRTCQHPAVLKAQVVSPGGTTAAGLNELEDGRLRALFAKAVKAAADRACEIGN
jgi:pyrroline-5-carboxylate reductase